MGVRLPPFAPSLSVNNLRLIFLFVASPAVSLQLRLGCRLLRAHRSVELIDETNIPSRNQMHILIGRDLDGAVPAEVFMYPQQRVIAGQLS
jgi:hypothetical protein